LRRKRRRRKEKGTRRRRRIRKLGKFMSGTIRGENEYVEMSLEEEEEKKI
jgi:hypothetical protein